MDLDGNPYQYNEQTGKVEYDAAAPAAPPTLQEQEAMIASILRDNCVLPPQPAPSQTGNFTCTKGHSLVREVSAICTAIVQSPNEWLSATRAQLV